MHELAIAINNLPAKFEVSISTHYEDMKDDTKCRKWGGLKNTTEPSSDAVWDVNSDGSMKLRSTYIDGVHIGATWQIPERPDPARSSCSASAIFRHRAAVCCKNTN